MGVGGLFVLKVALAIILKPFVLVGGAVAAGLGWWALKKSKSGVGAKAPLREPESKAAAARPTSAASPAVQSERALAVAAAERELDAALVAEVERRTEATVALGELDAVERRLQQLEALKAKMETER